MADVMVPRRRHE